MPSFIIRRSETFWAFVVFLMFCNVIPLPTAAGNGEAEQNYQRFLAIYRQDRPIKAELQNALSFLETANLLAPNTYKYVFSLGALNNALERWEEASRWLEKAQSLVSTEQQRHQIQTELEYCQIQMAKLRVSRWGGPGVSISFIMKGFTTVEMDKSTIDKLPQRFPVINIGDSPRPLEDTIKRMLHGMDIQMMVKDVFVIVGVEDDTPPEVHYERGIKDFYKYFRDQYFEDPPRSLLVVLISPRPHALVEATKRLYSEVGLTVYAPFLGYYNPADNLIMATGGSTGYGTLLHEMIHALIKADFPQAPSWLNEGLASLYERTQWTPTRLNTLPNWRMDRMREENVPSLQALARQAKGIGLHSHGIAEIRLLLLFMDQLQMVDDLYRMAKLKGPAFSLEKAIIEFGLNEDDWRSFVKNMFRDYRAEITRNRGALSNPDEVRFLQQALNDILDANLEVDGIWGPSTQEKLVEFQRRFQLKPDGIPGPRTMAELKRRYTLSRVKLLENTT